MISSFIAFPSKPHDLVKVIEEAHRQMKKSGNDRLPHLWKQNDIPGRFLRDPIIARISESDLFYADITMANFNVAY
ncbi:MAG: hypothetical protein AAF078_09495, partial [Planctomycetota bacterium]